MKKYIIIICLVLTFVISLKAQTNKAIITGTLEFLKNIDTVRIDIYKYAGFHADQDFTSVHKAKVRQDVFKIVIPASTEPQYVNINFSIADKNLRGLLIEKGDSVAIGMDHGNYFFTGRNTAKYNVALHLLAIYNKWHRLAAFDDPKLIRQDFEKEDSTALDQLAFLDSVKSQLSNKIYSLMRVDILSDNMFKGAYIMMYDKYEKSEPFLAALKSYKPNEYLEKQVNLLPRNYDNLIAAQFYIGGVINQYQRDSCYLLGKEFDVNGCYKYLKTNYKGSLRDALVTWLIFSRRNKGLDLSYLINDALGYVQFGDFRQLLLKLRVASVKGAAAFNFSLADANGNKVTCDDFKGKVVLLDFWYTGCPACAQTSPYLTKIERKYNDKPVVFVSICIDKNKAVWLKSIASGRYTGEYAVNLFTGGRGEDDPVIKHYQVSSYPALILIDKNGKLCGPVRDPRADGGEYLIRMIDAAL